jgi:hypothetical protein
MPFDELWRQDLARRRDYPGVNREAEGFDSFDGSNSIDSLLDDLDDDETDRYLEWLEKSLSERPRRNCDRSCLVNAQLLIGKRGCR